MTLKEIVTLPYPKPITLMRYIRKAIDSGELVIATTDAEV